MKHDHDKLSNLYKPESSTNVTDLGIPEARGIPVIQFGHQKDDDTRKLGTIHLKPVDEDDDPLGIMW